MSMFRGRKVNTYAEAQKRRLHSRKLPRASSNGPITYEIALAHLCFQRSYLALEWDMVAF